MSLSASPLKECGVFLQKSQAPVCEHSEETFQFAVTFRIAGGRTYGKERYEKCPRSHTSVATTMIWR